MIACRVPVSGAHTDPLDPVWLVCAPVAVSRNTLAAPAVVNSSIRTLADCPSVETIAYPYTLPPISQRKSAAGKIRVFSATGLLRNS